MEWWLYKRKLVRLFILLKILQIYWYIFIKTKLTIHQQINFIRKLEEDDGATMSFAAEKQQKPISNFSLDLFN